MISVVFCFLKPESLEFQYISKMAYFLVTGYGRWLINIYWTSKSFFLWLAERDGILYVCITGYKLWTCNNLFVTYFFFAFKGSFKNTVSHIVSFNITGVYWGLEGGVCQGFHLPSCASKCNLWRSLFIGNMYVRNIN